jgi:N-acetylglucosaminyldiphosphoundecaprenol N-acetyl-beta-D-mannosaminyltransferase
VGYGSKAATVVSKAARAGLERHSIAGIEFDFLEPLQTFSLIAAQPRGNPLLIYLVNPHTVMVCHRRPDVRNAIQEGDLVLPDGVGIALASRLLGLPRVARTPGPDLVLALCDAGRAKGFRHFFYGGAPHVAEQMVERLLSEMPDLAVAGCSAPPFFDWESDSEEADCRLINDAQADLVWIGLGSPKQEAWAARNRSRIQARAIIPVGAAFDFLSGRKQRAPEWIRKLGVEWLYRLLREPKRLWRRNLDSPLFVWEVLKQRFGAGAGGQEKAQDRAG